MDLSRKRNFKRETESLLIAAHANAIRTNHIKARIDKTQQNSKGGDREGLGSWRTGRYNPNDSIAENDQKPETSPVDLRRLTVTQTPGKNHQLTLI